MPPNDPFAAALANRRRSMLTDPKSAAGLQKITASAYADEARRQANLQRAAEAGAEAGQREAEENAKAKEKADKAAADKLKRERNNALEGRFRQQGRQFYVDADGLIQPSQTDEQWQQKQAEDRAAKEAAAAARAETAKNKVDTRWRTQQGAKINEAQAHMGENDDRVQSMVTERRRMVEHRARDVRRLDEDIKAATKRLEEDPTLDAETAQSLQDQIASQTAELERQRRRLRENEDALTTFEAQADTYRKTSRTIAGDLTRQETALPVQEAPRIESANEPPKPAPTPPPGATTAQTLVDRERAAAAAAPTPAAAHEVRADAILRHEDPQAWKAKQARLRAEAADDALAATLDASRAAVETAQAEQQTLAEQIRQREEPLQTRVAAHNAALAEAEGKPLSAAEAERLNSESERLNAEIEAARTETSPLREKLTLLQTDVGLDAEQYQETAKELQRRQEAKAAAAKQARAAELAKLETQPGMAPFAGRLRALDTEAEARVADLRAQWNGEPPEEEVAALEANLAERYDSLKIDIGTEQNRQALDKKMELTAAGVALRKADKAFQEEASKLPFVSKGAIRDLFNPEMWSRAVTPATRLALQDFFNVEAWSKALTDTSHTKQDFERWKAERKQLDDLKTAKRREAMQAAGLNPDSPEHQAMLEDASKMDWTSGSFDVVESIGSGKSAAQVEANVKSLYDALITGRNSGKVENSRVLSDGSILVNPLLIQSDDGYRKAVELAETSPEAKKAALEKLPELQMQQAAQLAPLMLNTPKIFPGESFASYIERSAPDLKGKPYKDLTEDERKAMSAVAADYLKEQVSRGYGWRLADKLGTAVLKGGMQLATWAAGTAGLVTTPMEWVFPGMGQWFSEGAGDLAMLGADFDAATEARTATGSAGRILGEGLTMGVVMAPLIAGGAVTASSVRAGAMSEAGAMARIYTLAGSQTAGMQYADVYKTLREEGKGHYEAFMTAAPAAITSGIVTAALTALGGRTGAEALIPTAARREAMEKAVRGFWSNLIRDVPKHAAKELVLEELPDELLTTIIDAAASGKDIGREVGQFLTHLPEFAGAVALLGGAGGAVEAKRNSLSGVARDAVQTVLNQTAAPAAGAAPAPSGPAPSTPATPATGAATPAPLPPGVERLGPGHYRYTTPGGNKGEVNSPEDDATALRTATLMATNWDANRPTPAPATATAPPAAPAPVPDAQRAEEVATAEAEVDTYLRTNSPATAFNHAAQITAARARALLKIGQGAKLEDLSEGELNGLGYRHDDEGNLERGYWAPEKPNDPASPITWKKGQPPPDKTYVTYQKDAQGNRQLVILDAALQRLGQTFPAVRAAIKLDEAGRRQQIRGEAPPASAAPAPTTTQAAPAPTTSPTPSAAPAAGTDGGPALLQGAPAAVQPPATPPATEPQLSVQEEERAEQIGNELARRGLPVDEAARVAAAIVRRLGVEGTDYRLQMATEAFDAAMLDEGWSRQAGTGKRAYVATPATKAAATTPPAPAPATSTSPAAQSPAPAPAPASKPAQRRRETAGTLPGRPGSNVTQSSVWKKTVADAMAAFTRYIAKGNPAQVKAAAQALRNLEKLLDSKLGGAFDVVRLFSAEGGGGMAATTDPDGTRVLLVDPLRFLARGAETKRGTEAMIAEELIHTLAMSVMTDAQAVELVRMLQATPQGQALLTTSWQAYFAVPISDGTAPATPPADMDDGTAYHVAHELIRQLVQDRTTREAFFGLIPTGRGLTTENAEVPKNLLTWLTNLLRRMSSLLRKQVADLPPAERGVLESYVNAIERLYNETLTRKRDLDEAMHWQAEAGKAVQRAAAPAPATPEPEPVADTIEDDLAAAADAELDAADAAAAAEAAAAKAKPQKKRGGPRLSKAMKEMPDVDNPELPNMIVYLAKHGKITRPSKDYLTRMRAEGASSKFLNGDWDWMRQSPVPFYWSNLLFQAGNGSTIDTAILALIDEGYFPGMAPADVTPQVFGDKLARTIAAYEALRRGESAEEGDTKYWQGRERQLVAFEEATAEGPVVVEAGTLGRMLLQARENPAAPRVAVQLKDKAGKLHRVEVTDFRLEPVHEDDFDPETYASHFEAEGGEFMRVAEVTLKDGEAFGVQQIDGDATLAVEEIEKPKAGAVALAAPVKKAWDAQEKQVQDASIQGIFATLYGQARPTGKGTQGVLRFTGDDARNLASLARRTLERDTGARAEAVPGKPAESARLQGAILADWARENGLLLTRLPAEFEPDGPLDDGQMEHHVWPSPDGQRLVKLTKPGRFGLWPVADGIGADLRAGEATPGRYLSRLEAANRVFDDDWVLHGILVNRRGEVQILTSQPDYTGETPGELVDDVREDEQDLVREQQMRLIQTSLGKLGFAPVRFNRSTYYRAADNTAVFDAHLYNALWVDTPEGLGLMPFDVTVMQPQGRLRENLQQSVQPLSSSVRRGQPSLFDETELSFLGDRDTLGLGEQVSRADAKQATPSEPDWVKIGNDLVPEVKRRLGDALLLSTLNIGLDRAARGEGTEYLQQRIQVARERLSRRDAELAEDDKRRDTEARRLLERFPTVEALDEEIARVTAERTKYTSTRLGKVGSFGGTVDPAGTLTDRILLLERAKGLLAEQAPPDAPAFSLESPTPEQLDAEKERAETRAKIQERQDKTLVGTQGDIGQMDMLGGGDLFSQPAAPKEAASRPNKASTSNRIEDFGEKIGGARKDVWGALRSKLETELPDDAANITLSKHWPEPDYERLIAEGGNPQSLAAFKALRDMIPPKPQRSYKLKQWGELVKNLHGLMQKAVAGNESTQQALENSLADPTNARIATQIRFYQNLGFPAVLRAKGWRLKRSTGYSVFMGRNISPRDTVVAVERDGRYVDGPNGNTLFSVLPAGASDAQVQEVARAFAEQVRPMLEAEPAAKTASSREQAAATSKYGIWTDRFTNDVFIGRKGINGVVRLKSGFGNVSDARAYRRDNIAEIEAVWESLKVEPDYRRPINEPRQGPERRQGDVTPTLFQETFGFRGVEFGNWVEGERRQQDLNESFDALMDLAEALGVPPRALSLDGSLGLAFGARGIAGAAAHYEPGKVVINLTKKAGPGSLAHEWWHAFDNYFARLDRTGETLAKPLDDYATRRRKAQPGHMREKVAEAFRAIVRVISSGPFAERSLRLDDAKSKPYYSTLVEKSARAFERYVRDRLADRLISSDYLVNIGKDDSEALPTQKEMEAGIKGAYDQLFTALETETTDRGVKLFSPERRLSPVDTGAHAAATSPLNDRPEPTEAQKKAGNYALGHVRVAGFDVSIENPAGSERKGTDRSGKPWSIQMRDHYGYIKGTDASDGDHLDVFIKPGTPADWTGPVFVARQVEPQTRRFDEYKVLMGYADATEATAAYRRNYAADWQGLDKIGTLTLEQFKKLASGGAFRKAGTADPKLALSAPAKRGDDPSLTPEYAQRIGRGIARTTEQRNAALAAWEDGQPERLARIEANQPTWQTIEGIEVLRVGNEPFVAVPASGRRNATNFDVIDLRDRSDVVAYLRKSEVKSWLAQRALAAGEGPSAALSSPARRVRPTEADVTKPANLVARLSNNLLDKALTKRLGAALEPAIQVVSKKADAAGEAVLAALTKWAVDGHTRGMTRALTPEELKEFTAQTRASLGRAMNQAQRQFVPDLSIPDDILAKRREMNIATAIGLEQALDIGKRSLEGKPKLSDLVVPEHMRNPEVRRRMFLAMNPRIPSGITLASLSPEEQAVVKRLQQLRRDIGLAKMKAGRLSLDAFDEMAESTAHYYEQDRKREGSILRQFVHGIRSVLAQRATSWYVEDTDTKDANGQPALVNWTAPDEKRQRWRFNDEAHQKAFYEDFIRRQILAAKDERHARKYAWMKPEEKAALLTVTMDKLLAPGTMTAAERQVADRLEEVLRRRFQKRKPLSYDEHEKAGLIMDPFYSLARQVAEDAHDNALAEFFNHIAASKDYTADVQRAGFTQIPDSSRFGRLAGRFVRDDVAAEVMQLMEVPSMAMKLYDGLLALFKTGKTVLNPGSHVRNVIGNIQFAALAGNNPLNPANGRFYADASRVLRDGGEMLQELYDEGVLGGDYLTAEVRRTLKALLPDPDSILKETREGSLAWLAGLKEHIARKLPAFLARPGSTLVEGASAAWKWEDDIYKAAAYLKARSLGLNRKQAADHVRKWFAFYDHGQSGFTKGLQRFAMPFLSFRRESLRIMKNALKERPISFLFTMALPRAITQLSLTVGQMKLLWFAIGLGLKDDRDEEDILKAMRGKKGRALDLVPDAVLGQDVPLFSILLPFRDANGGLMQWDLGNTMPFSDWLSTRVENTEDTDPWFSRIARELMSGGPFTALAIEMMTNEDTFTRRRIWEDDMTAGEKTAAFAGHVATELAPPITPGIGTSYRMIAESLVRQPSKLAPLRSTAQAVMRGLGGLDVRPAEPNLYRQANEYRAEHGLPLGMQNVAWPKDAVGRARAELFKALIQPTPNVDAVARELERLDGLGKPVRTLKDLDEMFSQRAPETIMSRKSHQGAFIRGLAPESRRVMDAAKAEFQRARRVAPAALMEARKRQAAPKTLPPASPSE